MSDQLNSDVATPPPGGAPSHTGEDSGFVKRLIQTFTAPSKAFIGLTSKTQWILATVILIALGFGSQAIQVPYLGPDLKKSAMENIERFKDQLPAEQYEEIVSQIENDLEGNLALTPKNMAIGVVMGFIFTALIALFCWMTGNFFLGGKRAFWEVLTVVAFCGFIGIVGDYLRGVMMTMKGTSYVYVGLGVLKPIPDGSFGQYFLRQLEFTTMWKLATMCIAFGALYAKPTMRFVLILTPMWLAFVALIAGANLFTGGTIVY